MSLNTKQECVRVYVDPTQSPCNAAPQAGKEEHKEAKGLPFGQMSAVNTKQNMEIKMRLQETVKRLMGAEQKTNSQFSHIIFKLSFSPSSHSNCNANIFFIFTIKLV